MKKVRRSWYPLSSKTTTRERTLKKASPIDPLSGPKLALAGRIVTMDAAFSVVNDGAIYIDAGVIVAVQDRKTPPPAGFEAIAPLATRGTIYPGLIELHNHLCYNVLPLWSPVPKRFEHRGQWPDHPDYRKLISGPMTVIGEYRDEHGQAALLAPLVRYVECKCLLGGVTTTQGIMLNSNAGVQRFYRGIVRNVEQTDDPALSEALGRIADVDAKDAKAFLARLKKEDSCMLLHLSEGVTRDGQTDSIARKHFLALQVAPDQWAINDRFSGIHAAGLLPEDFQVLAAHGGSMVWSPLSNLLLYGDTARVIDARKAGVRIALGSDWSPSGSKNLLGELKIAWLYSQKKLGGFFKASDILAMATRDAAAVLKWDKALGSLEAGKRADILVIFGRNGEAHQALIEAKETAIQLVMINGVARYGTPANMKALGAEGEALRVGRTARRLFLGQETSDPDVAKVSLGDATRALRDALQNIAALAAQLETVKPKTLTRTALDAPEPVVWALALDELRDTGVEQRPRLPFAGPKDFTGPERAVTRASKPLSGLLQPIALDPLTVADDPGFLTSLANQPNVPEEIRAAIASLY
jgi:cytosine/adenosine deaminase-related metal-dependent hydrolase